MRHATIETFVNSAGRLLLAAGLAASVAGCNGYDPNDRWVSSIFETATEAERRIKREKDETIPAGKDLYLANRSCELVKEGLLEVGLLYYIGQVHRAPDRIFDSEAKMAEVSRYQLNIARELQALKIKHVFMEGFTENVLASDFEKKEKEKKTKGIILDNFPNGIPEKLTPTQQFFINIHGGAYVYACQNPGVSLYATMTPEQAALLEMADKDFAENRNVKVYTNIIFDEREKWAAEKVELFLVEHPGARVALVYGKAHNFKDDITIKPRMYYISFKTNPNLFPNLTPDEGKTHFTEELEKQVNNEKAQREKSLAKPESPALSPLLIGGSGKPAPGSF